MNKISYIFSSRVLQIIAVLFAIAELIARAGLFGIDGITHPGHYTNHEIHQMELVQYSEHDKIGWELSPGKTGYLKGVKFEINKHGMRDSDVTREKPHGFLRIAVVGRSFSAGQGVNQSELWTEHFEKIVNEKSPNKIEVLNFSVPSYNYSQIEHTVYSKVLKFSPDLILLPIHLNEWDRIYSTIPLPILENLWERLSSIEYILNWSFFVTIARRATKDFFNSFTSGDWRTNPLPYLLEDQPTDKLKEFFIRMAELPHKLNINLIFVSMPSYLAPQRQAAIKPLSTKIQGPTNQDPSVDFYPIAQDLFPYFTLKNGVFYGDPHPSAKLHKMTAEKIAEKFIKAQIQ